MVHLKYIDCAKIPLPPQWQLCRPYCSVHTLVSGLLTIVIQKLVITWALASDKEINTFDIFRPAVLSTIDIHFLIKGRYVFGEMTHHRKASFYEKGSTNVCMILPLRRDIIRQT